MYRFLPLAIVILLTGAFAALMAISPWFAIGVVFFAALSLLGLYDLLQTSHTLWRNYPILARIRWIAEELRPFLRSYIVESETEGRPFNHEERTMVYRRSKDVSSVEPFGSQLDIDKPPYEWLSHSIAARHNEDEDPRVMVGALGTAKA